LSRENSFSRTELLIGTEGIKKLEKSCVAVFGIGGVGSFVVEGLVRAGVGEFLLIDYDMVSVSNINRQIHALQSTVGRPKAEVMAERIKDINPNARVEVRLERYVSERSEELFSKHMDYVVDAVDDIEAKVSLAEECLKREIAFISSMGTGRRINAASFKVSDIKNTEGDPLAKKFRKLLRLKGIESGVKVVYSPEPPLRVLRKDENDLDEQVDGYSKEKEPLGSISFVPSVVGLLLAGEVVRDILN